MTVRDAVLRAIEIQDFERDMAWLDEHRDKEPRLFLSDLGGCPRKAIWAAYQAKEGHPFCVQKTHPFDMYLKEKFKFGRDFEEITAQELESAKVPIRRVDGKRNIPVGNDVWHGRVDIMAEPCEDFPAPTVIEVKTTSSWNFATGDTRRLPYESHCYQVLSYRYFLDGHDAKLYYRSCDNKWAEFDVYTVMGSVVYEGKIMGTEVSGSFNTTIPDQMHRIDQFWPDQLPPRYLSPTFLEFGCTKRVKGNKAMPACVYFSHCWDVEVPIQL